MRAYVRDPRQAVEAASTVRGYGLERQRVQKLAKEQEQFEGKAAGHRETPPSDLPPPKSRWERAWRAWRDTPLKWTPLPIVAGAGVLVAVQAHRAYKQREERVVDNASPVSENGSWTVYVLGALPLNAVSRAWGWLNSCPLPVWFRPYGFRLYAWLFGCDLNEMNEQDLTKYASLAEFFGRELKPGLRPIAADDLVSPADGKILHLGVVDGDRVEQVKGLTYSLRSLLGLGSHAQSHETADFEVGDKDATAHRTFAKVNGIDYSVTQLLGEKSRIDRAKTYARGWVRGAWTRLKNWATWRSPAYRDLPIRPASEKEIAADLADDARNPENGDVGIPTSDTLENVGHYANVAYEMGPQALPPLQNEWRVAPNHKLYFCVIYLAPGDYHRFHSPAPWVVEMRRHFRGELYSVSPYIATRLPNLFVLNERVALLGRWRYGLFSMTPIGATNVGSIQIHFDRLLRTNLQAEHKLRGTYVEATYNAASRVLGGQPLAKGDEMGSFLLGSTIVLVFEAPESFHFVRQAGEKVKVGEALGRT